MRLLECALALLTLLGGCGGDDEDCSRWQAKKDQCDAGWVPRYCSECETSSILKASCDEMRAEAIGAENALSECLAECLE